MHTGSASGLFSKKQYAANAAQRFMRKLCTERWREWTRLALFLSSSLIHSIIYRLRSIILSHKGISLIISLLDICPLRFRMRLYPSSMGAICRFLVNSASKFLQNSSNIQNISGVSLNEVKNFVCGNHRYICSVSYWFSIIKLQNNSEITNFLENFFIPNWRKDYILLFRRAPFTL